MKNLLTLPTLGFGDLFKKKKELSIFPTSVSQSITSIALLLVTDGAPFNSYKPADLDLSELEDRFVRPACHCYMLYLIPSYFDSLEMGETVVGSILAVVNKQNPTVAKLLDMGLALINETFFLVANNYHKDEDAQEKVVSSICQMWVMVMDSDNELNEDERNKLAEKLYNCIAHCVDISEKSLRNMVTSVTDFDLENIPDVWFRSSKIGLLEKLLRDRVERRYLYPHKDLPTAQDLYKAREQEKKILKELNDEFDYKQQLLSSDMERATDNERVFKVIKDYVLGSEDIKSTAKRIGTNYSEVLTKSIEHSNAGIYPLIEKTLQNLVGEEAGKQFLSDLLNPKAEYKVMEIFSTFKYIQNDVLPSYILSLDEDDFEEMVKHSVLQRRIFEEFLESTKLLRYCDDQQKHELLSRVSRFQP